MSWGCLTFILLFPVGLLVWPTVERNRRKKLTAEELAEEQFGQINPDITCIYCKRTGGVRTRDTAFYTDTGCDVASIEGIETVLADRRSVQKQTALLKAKCMNCGPYWDMFPPKNIQD